MTLGIDFSIKSTAATLFDSENYNFYTFARSGVINEQCLEHLRNHGVKCNITDENPLPKKTASITERERGSFLDAKILIDKIKDSFKDLSLNGLSIEGFSFGSTGNRLAQISGYQWVLRWETVGSIVDIDNFYVFAPMTVKATAGKGNFKKEQMIDAFINSNDQCLKSSDFHRAMKDAPFLFQNKKGAWLKPIDDICDSYWVLKTLQNVMKKQ